MKKYKYTGQITVFVAGVGEVKPGQIIETEVQISNPNFEIVENEEQIKSPKKEIK